MPLLASDSFNRADANPISGSWSTIGGASNPMQIVTNQARGSVAANAFNASYWNGLSWPDDQYSTALIVASLAGTFPGIGVRMSASAQTGYFGYAEALGAGSTLYIQRRVAGVLVNLTTGVFTVNANDRLQLDVRGNLLILRLNGVQKLQTTDNNILAGSAGIVSVAAVVADAIVDSWEGGSLLGRTRDRHRPRN